MDFFHQVLTSLHYFQVCYVAFWDEITLATQEAQGQKIGDDNFIGKWRIVIIKNLPFTDQRLNGKIPKVGCYCFVLCF